MKNRQLNFKQLLSSSLVGILVAISLQPALCAEQKPTCAILTFDVGGNIHSGQAGLLANHYSVIVNDTGLYNLIPRYHVNKTLMAKHFNWSKPSIEDLAVSAGRILKVKYVIAGIIEKKGNKYTLSTLLVNVEKDKHVAIAITSGQGTFTEFMNIEALKNMRVLLKIPAKPKEQKPLPLKNPKRLEQPEPAQAVKPVPNPVIQKTPAQPPVKTEKNINQEPVIKKTVHTPPQTNALYSTLSKWASSCSEQFAILSRDTSDMTKDHLEIGWRFTHFWLVTEKDEFIGSIDTIRAEQSYLTDNFFLDHFWPNGLYFNWLIDENLAIELTYTLLQASTWSHGNHHTDGTLQASGPILTVLYRFPNNTGYTPYAGAGLAFFISTDVTTDNPWHHGFEGGGIDEYNAWIESGAPEWPNNGYQRTFSLDNPIGYVINMGIDKSVSDNLQLDLNLRYTDVTFDNTFTLSWYNDVGRTRYNEFDLSNFALSIGVKHMF
ncbi:MAG: hypothetical protein KAH23_04750 [Kiritimatiellae bacterium]|nr:hypothetical protein [Kiritimatiellia bacterium]